MDTACGLVTGIIRTAHGLQGKFKVESSSGEVEHFFKLTEVTLRKGSFEKLYQVDSVEGSGSGLIMKLAGIDTPEAVEKLRGAEIVVPRDKACPLKKDEWYVEDLKQCTLVYDTTSEKGVNINGLPVEGKPTSIVVGHITDVLEGGAGDLLEVAVSENLHGDVEGIDGSGKQKVLLVPFKNEFIGTVDIKRKTVQLMHLWILEI